MEKRYRLKKDLSKPEFFLRAGTIGVHENPGCGGTPIYEFDRRRFDEPYMKMFPDWFEEVSWVAPPPKSTSSSWLSKLKRAFAI